MLTTRPWLRYSFCGFVVLLLVAAVLQLSGSRNAQQTIEFANWRQWPANVTLQDATTRTPEPFYLHYVRFKSADPGASTEFRFLDYLSVQSALLRLQPDHILLHGDFLPTGFYWDQLNKTKLVHKKRKPAKSAGAVQGSPKPLVWKEHAADMAKLDVLLEYGGVAVDFDVFFVRGYRIKRILETKKAIVCYGDSDAYNMGFVAGKKDSKLLAAWRRSYEDMYITEWNFNQGVVPRYLSTVFRDEVYVVDQVCNNPHTSQLQKYFLEYGTMNWADSIAIHSYERWSGIGIKSPEDLKGALTTHKELLISIYERQSLPPENFSFRDEMDPSSNKLLSA